MKNVIAGILLAAAAACAALAQSLPGEPTGAEAKITPRVIGAFVGNGGCANCGTLPSVSFGTPYPDRYIACSAAVGTAASFTSLTIGGVAASNVCQANNGTQQFKIGIAFVPTGTSGTVTYNGWTGTGTAAANCYSIRGSYAPTTPQFQGGTSSFAPTFTLRKNSYALAGVFYFNSGGGSGSFSGNLPVTATTTVALSVMTNGSGALPAGGSTGFGVAMAGPSPTGCIAVWEPPL